MENDNIFKAIEAITMKHIVCYHVENNNYAFKLFTPLFGKYWHTINCEHVDEIASAIKFNK